MYNDYWEMAVTWINPRQSILQIQIQRNDNNSLLLLNICIDHCSDNNFKTILVTLEIFVLHSA